MNELVHAETQAGVTTVRLQRPPFNAFDDDLIADLRRVIDRISTDQSTRCVVVTGGAHFSVGADIGCLQSMDFEGITRWNGFLHKLMTRVSSLPMPVIAAMEGYALGGGLEFALCADYRISGSGARVGLPEAKLGILPGCGGTQRLTQIVGRSRAKEIIMSGRTLDATEAAELGILDEVVAEGDGLGRAQEQAKFFATGARHALGAIKEAVDAAAPVDERGLALERTLLAGLFATRDAQIGFDHFLSKGRGAAPFGRPMTP